MWCNQLRYLGLGGMHSRQAEIRHTQLNIIDNTAMVLYIYAEHVPCRCSYKAEKYPLSIKIAPLSPFPSLTSP